MVSEIPCAMKDRAWRTVDMDGQKDFAKTRVNNQNVYLNTLLRLGI